MNFDISNLSATEKQKVEQALSLLLSTFQSSLDVSKPNASQAEDQRRIKQLEFLLSESMEDVESEQRINRALVDSVEFHQNEKLLLKNSNDHIRTEYAGKINLLNAQIKQIREQKMKAETDVKRLENEADSLRQKIVILERENSRLATMLELKPPTTVG